MQAARMRHSSHQARSLIQRFNLTTNDFGAPNLSLRRLIQRRYPAYIKASFWVPRTKRSTSWVWQVTLKLDFSFTIIDSLNRLQCNSQAQIMKNIKYPLLFPLALVFYEMATYLSNDMYLPSLPTLVNDFNTSENAAQNTLLAWFLGSASMQLIMGPLSDRFGRRIILLIGGCFFILSSIVCAITHDISVMLIARFIQGSTVCSVVVAGYAAIHEQYDSKMAIKLIAIMGSVTVLAPAFGPLLGAVIIEISQWRTIFYVLTFWALLGIIILYFVMPETNPNKISLNFREIIKDYIFISKHKAFLGYTLSFCFLFLALIFWVVESPFVIIETYQRSVIEFGVIQFFVFVCFIFGSQVTRLLIAKTTALQVIEIGLIIALCGGIILPLSFYFTDPHLYWVVFLMMIITFGTSIAFGPLNRSAIDCCNEPMGRRMAIFSSYMSFFGVIATFLVTVFNEHGMNELSLLISLGVILAFLIFFGAKKLSFF